MELTGVIRERARCEYAAETARMVNFYALYSLHKPGGFMRALQKELARAAKLNYLRPELGRNLI